MDYMLLPLQRYADFSGRSRRKEYWMFVLGQLLAFILLWIVAGILGGFSSDSGDMPMIFMVPAAILLLALIIPSLAVQVRRFHDQDKSGWFVLLNFIPYVGSIVVFVFMCLDGTPGENRFGPDPKQAHI